jgi:hypothetical protein
MDSSREPKLPGVIRWLVRLGLVVGALLVLLVVAFVVANLPEDGPGRPLYTNADLPEPPPKKSNGWILLRDRPSSGWSKASEARAFVLVALDETTAETPSRLVSQAPAVDASYERSLADCRAAYERPRFVDVCPATIEARCPSIEIFQCHNLVSFEVLRRLGAGERRAGLALARNLVRGSLDHVATAHSLIGQSVAQSNLETVLGLVRAMRGWLPGDTVAPLVALLSDRAPVKPPDELALMGEYLFFLDGIERVMAGRSQDISALLFDEGQTRRILDDAFRVAIAGGELHVDNPLEDRLWWFDNAGGDMLLSTLAPSEPAWSRLKAQIAANEVLLASLTSP